MPTTIAGPLSPTQMRQWEDDGYLLLRGLIPPSTIASVRAMLERVVDRMIAQLKTENLIQDEGKDLPLETRFAKVAGAHANKFGRSWRRAVGERETFDLHLVPALVDVIAQLTATDVIGHPVFNARPKLPGQQLTVVPWHQDSSYFDKQTEKSLIITCWIPFVPVDESNGVLQVEKRSHHRGLLEHGPETREGNFPFLEIKPPDIVDPSQIVTCPMQPGDVLLFPNLTNHRSLASTSPTIRWSIDVRYVRDGDYAGAVAWPNKDFKWVIQSNTQPLTTYEQWKGQVDQWAW